jgi:hypothetical protein
VIGALHSLVVWPAERLIDVERIANLLRRPNGVTMSHLVAALRERRDIISNDMETMRDYLGYPIRCDPANGTYRLDALPKTYQPSQTGCDLALLERAIALEEYLYVTFATETGASKCLHAMPTRARKVRGKRQVKLLERSGAWRLVDLEAILELVEAFGSNK